MNKSSIAKSRVDVLKIIAKNLEHSDSNWVIIASSALALHGLDVDPIDVDIMTDDHGLVKINKALGTYAISLSENNPSATFASTMSKFCINSCTIEVMSNFKVKSGPDNRWYDVDYLLQYRTMIALGDVTVPVLPLKQLIELYTLMGRDKDMRKIEKIEQYVIQNTSHQKLAVP